MCCPTKLTKFTAGEFTVGLFVNKPKNLTTLIGPVAWIVYKQAVRR